jgi:hypothetical protein
MPTLIRDFVSNMPGIDPDAPIPFGLTPWGWAVCYPPLGDEPQ